MEKIDVFKVAESVRDQFVPKFMEIGIVFDHLLAEFQMAADFGIEYHELPKGRPIVVVLSSANDGENMARVREGVSVCRRMPYGRVRGRDVEEGGVFSNDEIPKLMLHGVDRNVAIMQQAAIDSGYPVQNILCRSIGVDGNTKDQIHHINREFSESEQSFVFVTSAYHVPRTNRTVKKQLSPHLKGVVASVTYARGWFPGIKIVGGPVYHPANPDAYDPGEIKRIFEYTKKGDL